MLLLLGIALVILLAVLVVAYYCFRVGFYAPPRKPEDLETIQLPEGKIYEPYHAAMKRWIQETRAMPQEDMCIQSFDGLTLWGTYYEYAPGAPIELMFHGYRGNAERELAAGVQRAFKLGRSALLVDQRGCGRSGGNVISFGINESKDCIRWVNFMVEHFGPEVKIILTGMSMGAATVMMASDKGLPKNVVGILADCGFHSPKDIIKTVIPQMGFPAWLGYPFVKLGARLFGHFDLEQTTAEEALKNCTIPVIFFHGEEDDFVPCDMSRICYEACASRKKLVTVPGAGHGLSYPVAPARYLEELREFFRDI